MCGFCVEGTAIELAKALTLGKAWPPELEQLAMFDVLYMEESPDVSSAFLRIEHQLKEIITRWETENSNAKLWKNSHLRIAFCCIVETLVKKGFESKEYQNLITIPCVPEIIKSWCQIEHDFDERFFTPDSLLRNIFQRDFFFDREHCSKVLSNPTLLKDCIALLTVYVDWWHSEQENFVDDLDLAQTMFPFVFLSLIMIQVHYPTHKVIAQMVSETPGHFGGSFDTFEMWLQRKAALMLYDTVGLSAFLPYGNRVRPPLVYYLVVKNKLNSEAKQNLREAVLQSGRYKPERDFPRKARDVNLCTELFIMEHLGVAA